MSEKTRRWAQEIIKDFGGSTMQQHRSMYEPLSLPLPLPASEPPPPSKKRAYRPVTDADIAAWKEDRDKGMSFSAIGRKHDRSDNLIGKHLKAMEPPRPEREPNEPWNLYGIRLQKWMRETDPKYREANRQARSRGQKLAHQRRRRAARKQDPLLNPPPAPVPVGFWRKIGLFLGVVR